MEEFVPLVAFGVVLLFFHSSELAIQCLFNPDDVNLSSLLLTPQYCAAMVLAIVEFLVEVFVYPDMKRVDEVFWTGLALVVFGEFIRKGAMIQAGVAFTHQIKTSRRENHHLVKTGFYRFLRHPGYFGWYVWAVSTQVMLANPVSVVVFAVVAGYFFYDRIPYEEAQLIRFFGQEYLEYRKRTWVCLPFVPSTPCATPPTYQY